MWRHREACVEAKWSREAGVSVQDFDKKLDSFTPEGYLGCMLNVRVFWSFAECLYRESWLVGEAKPLGGPLICFAREIFRI